MPVPKKRHSKTRKNKRRANWKAHLPHLIACPQCKAMIISHRVCPSCGFYKGKTLIEIKKKEKKKEEK